MTSWIQEMHWANPDADDMPTCIQEGQGAKLSSWLGDQPSFIIVLDCQVPIALTQLQACR